MTIDRGVDETLQASPVWTKMAASILSAFSASLKDFQSLVSSSVVEVYEVYEMQRSFQIQHFLCPTQFFIDHDSFIWS